MQKVFYSLTDLDKRAEKDFNLKNGILMENAARGSAEKIKQLFNLKKRDAKKTIQIICGSGDNGGDGLALARMLADDFNVIVVCAKEPKSELCKLQKERLAALNIPVKKAVSSGCDILFDAFLGTGIRGRLKNEDKKLIEKMNKIEAVKIACDIPSGLNLNGIASPVAFKADITFSMGALKTAFFSDEAKDLTGKIEVIDLGIPRSRYETDSNIFLLETSDLILPERKLQNTHKRNFGHAGILCGEKKGACFLAASAALKFGAGVLTVCAKKEVPMPFDFMYSAEFLTEEFTAAAIGPGLGKNNFDYASSILADKKNRHIAFVLDADIFYFDGIKEIVPYLKKAVLTPHPKEFAALLKNCGLGTFSVTDIQQDRLGFVKLFCTKYPETVLILKGANVLIGYGNRIFINPLGSSALSKAGAGDVLTGLITALLAQNYPPLDAAISASLAHSLASRNIGASYGLTASALIKNLEKLEGRQLKKSNKS